LLDSDGFGAYGFLDAVFSFLMGTIDSSCYLVAQKLNFSMKCSQIVPVGGHRTAIIMVCFLIYCIFFICASHLLLLT
jgi:hypothetical protein